MRSAAAVLAALAVTVLFAAGRTVPADDLATVPRITIDELKKGFDKMMVVDVRSAEAYRAGHIAGALSIPGDTLIANVAKLKASKRPIVTYCA
jgi:phage shock protein E